MSEEIRGESQDNPDRTEAPPLGELGAESPFPIVGIGASAGGLEVFTQLLSYLPARTRVGATGSTPADFQKEADRLLVSRYA
ncbi:MAG: hypothetical protein ACREVH_12490, partial [Gammaproteobacteria bacterium]